MIKEGALSIRVDKYGSGKRLDAFVASVTSRFSRSFAAKLICQGNILVQGRIKKPGYRLKTDEKIYIHIPSPEQNLLIPDPAQIDILFEDEHIILINKQPDLVVHPAPGHYSKTLVNRLLYHCPDIEGVGDELRPGIVHRLDKDTSGIIIIAKNNFSHINLSAQFKCRKVKKEYLALVYGDVKAKSGIISKAIGRHPVDRKKMSTASRHGKLAVSLWKIKERYHGFTLLQLSLKTGRTHQVRVHCASIGHPVVGDTLYYRRGAVKHLLIGKEFIKSVKRQMLHAWRIKFKHPASGKDIFFEAPIPDDMEKLIYYFGELGQQTVTFQ